MVRARLCCAALMAALVLVAPARAQETAEPARSNGTGLTTPRSTMRGYFEAARAERWNVAAQYLDLRGVPAARRDTVGPELAERLERVLDRTLWVDVASLSDAAEGDTDDGQPEGRDLVGTIQTEEGPIRVYVERLKSADGSLEWRISRTILAELDRLHEDVSGEPPLVQKLPPVFFEYRFLGTELWQWLALGALLLAATLVALVLGWLVLALARLVVRRAAKHRDDTAVRLAVGPVRLMLGVAVFRAGLHALWLPVPVYEFFAGMAQGVFIVGVTWLIMRVVAVLAQLLQLRMAHRGDRMGISAVPLIRRVLSALIILFGIVAIIGSLGVNVTGILAGLGVGGLAVALAAQKSLENLFGGVTLIVDQPVHVGDFCRFGERVGTVEDIGLRSTRIRTLDRTLVTIPNSEFSSMQIENYARRDRIWLSTTIGVRYETTPDQLRFLLIALKRMLLAHPMIDPEPARVRFAGFGASSLDVDIFAYVRTTDYNEFLAVREDVFLRVMETVETSGTGFAFPSQTIYTAADSGLDDERGRAAEAQVTAWRDAGELAMPNPSPQIMDEIADTLDYPPKGSSSSG